MNKKQTEMWGIKTPGARCTPLSPFLEDPKKATAYRARAGQPYHTFEKLSESSRNVPAS
jgi:hypothetical protein